MDAALEAEDHLEKLSKKEEQMRAHEEARRIAAAIESGEMDAQEPLFVLRARDITAAATVRGWTATARELGCPTGKTSEAIELALEMELWWPKQIPGRPDSLIERELTTEEPWIPG